MDNNSINRHVLTAIERMLTAVMRFALARSILYPQIELALRRALVGVARERIDSNNRQSISALSILTGLQRKQVKESSNSTTSPIAESIITKVIGTWCTHPDYSDGKNAGRPLTTVGTSSEFFELVSSLTTDVSPYSVLNALEQLGAIERLGDRIALKLKVHASLEIDKALEFMALDFSDLVQTIDENLSKTQRIPNLHLTTVYDNVCADAAQELREWILAEGTQFHERLRQKISQLDKDSNPTLYEKKGGVRVMVSAFSRITEGD